MNSSILHFFTAVIFAASGLAYAHNGDGDSLPGGPGSNGINVGSGVMIELGEEDAPVQILIAVSYPGVLRETGDEHVSHRYFWVSAQTAVTTHASDEGSILTTLGLSIVPVSRIHASHGIITSLKYLPMDVRREVHAGLNASASVSVIGWTRYAESAMGSDPSEGELARVVKFAQVATDVIGLRFANLQGHGSFLGSQLASVQMQAGLGWNINQRMSLRVSIGGRGVFSMGRLMEESGVGMIVEDGVNARVQAFFNTAHAILNAYFEVGYHRMDLVGPGFSADSEEPGHPYLMIGAGAAF